MHKFNAKNYWEARLSENYNSKGVGDIGLSIAYNDYIYRIRVKAFNRAVNGLFEAWNKLAVLDVGSGTGFYIGRWQNLNVGSLSGADITQKAVEMLTNKFPKASFRQMDIGESIDPEDIKNQYDVVSAFDMLYHIVDDSRYDQALKNFSLLVKHNGYLVFSENLLTTEEVRLEHQVSRTEEHVFAELKNNGFQLVRRVPMFVFMNDPVRTNNRIMRKLFSITYRLASKSERSGKLIGSLLYPIESFLIGRLNIGPSTETFVWKKIR